MMDELKFQKLNILEIGPGKGALVNSILDYLKNNNLKLYKSVNYRIVEISENLCKHVDKKLKINHQNLYDKG